jgi:hypothetical protein
VAQRDSREDRFWRKADLGQNTASQVPNPLHGWAAKRGDSKRSDYDWKRTGDREVAGFLFEVSPAGGLRKSIE